MKLGEQGGSELGRQDKSPLHDCADGAEKPLPGRVGHDEPGSAGTDKTDYVSVVGIESQDDHRRVPGRFPHLPEGLLSLRRDGQDLESGPGADQGVDAGRGGPMLIEENQREASDHQSMFAVDGDPDNPSEGPRGLPLKRGDRMDTTIPGSSSCLLTRG